MKNINEQKLIYFYSPMGTWIRINKNLEDLGLDKNKKVANTYTRDFIDSVFNNTYMEKYKDYDVIFLDEFYDHQICDYEAGYEAMKKLIKSGKQIVMAGHGELDSLIEMPEEMKKNISSYNLIYGLDISNFTNINYIF